MWRGLIKDHSASRGLTAPYWPRLAATKTVVTIIMTDEAVIVRPEKVAARAPVARAIAASMTVATMTMITTVMIITTMSTKAVIIAIVVDEPAAMRLAVATLLELNVAETGELTGRQWR